MAKALVLEMAVEGRSGNVGVCGIVAELVLCVAR